MTDLFPNADDALLLLWRDAIATRGDWSDFDGRTLLETVEHVIRYAHGDAPRPHENYDDSWGLGHDPDRDERIKAITWSDFPRRIGGGGLTPATPATPCTIEFDESDGWDVAICSCGWESPPVPGKDIAADMWADHLGAPGAPRVVTS